MLKSLGKTVNCCLKLFNIVWVSTTFVKIDESLENYLEYLTKVHGIPQSFLGLKLLGLKLSVCTKFRTVLPRSWPKSDASHEYHRYLIDSCSYFGYR